MIRWARPRQAKAGRGSGPVECSGRAQTRTERFFRAAGTCNNAGPGTRLRQSGVTGGFSANGRGDAGRAQDSGTPASIVPASPAICRRRRPGGQGARDARAAACALLPGLLSTLFAPPALAQSALVSNAGQSTNTHVELASNKSSQRFTAGSHSTGYLLSSIVLDGDFAGYTAGTVTLHSTDRSGAKVADFTASLNSSSHLVLTPTKPTGLATGSEYAILTDTDFNTGDWNSTSSDSEDSGASPGWSIRNTSEVEIGSWTNVSRSFQITVNGQTRAANTEATGQPAISGRANVGQTLTATLGTVNDVNGIPSDIDYQWTRYDGSDETEIANATNSTYTLQGADRNSQIAVRISFTDSAGYAESRKSDYYPSSGAVGPVHGGGDRPGRPFPAPGGEADRRAPRRGRAGARPSRRPHGARARRTRPAAQGTHPMVSAAAAAGNAYRRAPARARQGNARAGLRAPRVRQAVEPQHTFPTVKHR